ncbi:MAG: hypothetical protein KGL46_00800 [Hyphomicrobiales bacterium]|nr:hypothetical protein [Hyphomicrobiales bacterium]
MKYVQSAPLLRRFLTVDAAFSGVCGLVLALGAGALAPLLGLPHQLVLGAGIFLLPYAAFVGWLGQRADLPRALVWFVVAGNILWTLESVILLFSGQVAPTTFGIAVVVIQAAAVALFAEMQALGLTRSTPIPA